MVRVYATRTSHFTLLVAVLPHRCQSSILVILTLLQAYHSCNIHITISQSVLAVLIRVLVLWASLWAASPLVHLNRLSYRESRTCDELVMHWWWWLCH